MDARPFWHDETPVALTIINNNFLDMFYNIVDFQKAPLLFWSMLKVSCSLFGNNELTLRLFPFISSVISIFIFYFFSKELLNKKYSIVIANILFGINYQLLYFSQELKQYSSDVLFFLIALIIFPCFLRSELNFKKMLLCILFSMFLILSSFPACFVIAGFIGIKIFNLRKTELKNFIIYIILIALLGLWYYIKFLSETYNHEIEYLSTYWESGFITLSNAVNVFENLYMYFFKPNFIFLSFAILSLYGSYLVFKEKNMINRLLGLTLLFVILASALSFYPLCIRVAVYLIPVFIILSIKPFDEISDKKIKNTVIIFLFFLSFSGYFNNIYYSQFMEKDVFTLWDGKETLKYIKENYEENDVILINEMSKRDYEYYSDYLGFLPDNIEVYDYRNKSKQEFFEYIENLDGTKKYWFYSIFAGDGNNEQLWLKEWKNKNYNKVIDEYKKEKSYILKI